METEGQLSPSDALLDRVTATAYGANVRLSAGSLGIDAPNPFHFAGFANEIGRAHV